MRTRFKPSVDHLEDRAVPATITVTSLADNLDADGQITLREAIQAANTDASVDGSTAGAGADLIQFDSSIAGGTVNLSIIGGTVHGPSALIIGGNISIQGTGETIQRGAASPNMRLFYSPGFDLALSQLTLANGAAVAGNGGTAFGSFGGGGGGGVGQGGAIYFDGGGASGGRLNITSCTFTDNLAQGGNGGNGQGLGVSDAGGGAGGGGSAGDGGDVLDDGSDGGAGGGGTFGDGGDSDGGGANGAGGGGDMTDGANSSAGGAGGMNGGFAGGSFGGPGKGGRGNHPGGGGGGGAEDVEIFDQVIGGGGGGGGRNSRGASTFAGGGGGASDSLGVNRLGGEDFGAFGGRGGSARFGSGGGGGGAGVGGAIYQDLGVLTITNCTFSGNAAVGGSGGLGSQAAFNGEDGIGAGGAVYGFNAVMYVLNSTFTENAAQRGRGIFIDAGAGPSAVSSSRIDNTLIGQSDTDFTDFEARTFNDNRTTPGTGNLIRRAVRFSGEIVSTADPQLGPLQDNGGFTFTHLPADFSPAGNSGNDAAAAGLTTDQRGFARFAGAAIDIGSVEFDGGPDLGPGDGGGGGGTPPAGIPGGPTTSATAGGRFIERLYFDLLGRRPDSFAGKYVTDLDSGERSKYEVAHEVAHSHEYLARVLTDLYLRFLNRAPDAEGLASYVHDIQDGKSLEEVKIEMLTSAEYRAHSNSAAGFLANLYSDVLGRAPDAEAAFKYGVIYGAGTEGEVAKIVREVVTSDEARRIEIDKAYAVLLNRAPDPQSRIEYAGQLETGRSILDVIAELAASDEYGLSTLLV
jgi:CSLREA domain-containing protein